MEAHVPRLVVLFVARGAPKNAREDAVGLEGEVVTAMGFGEQVGDEEVVEDAREGVLTP
jgi:hypothetical protein